MSFWSVIEDNIIIIEELGDINVFFFYVIRDKYNY